jgi:hypothetical protein
MAGTTPDDLGHLLCPAALPVLTVATTVPVRFSRDYASGSSLSGAPCLEASRRPWLHRSWLMAGLALFLAPEGWLEGRPPTISIARSQSTPLWAERRNGHRPSEPHPRRAARRKGGAAPRAGGRRRAWRRGWASIHQRRPKCPLSPLSDAARTAPRPSITCQPCRLGRRPGPPSPAVMQLGRRQDL